MPAWLHAHGSAARACVILGKEYSDKFERKEGDAGVRGARVVQGNVGKRKGNSTNDTEVVKVVVASIVKILCKQLRWGGRGRRDKEEEERKTWK